MQQSIFGEIHGVSIASKTLYIFSTETKTKEEMEK